MHSVVTRFVNLTTLKSTDGEDKADKEKKDGILEYAKECLTFCLLKAEFDDGSSERVPSDLNSLPLQERKISYLFQV